MRKLSSFVCPKNNLSLTGTYYCQRSSPSSFTDEYNLPPSSLDYKSFSFETDIAYESRFYTLVTPPDASVQLTSTRSYTASPTSNTCRKPDRFEFEPAISGTVIPNTLSSSLNYKSFSFETDIAYESRFYTLVTPPDASVQLTSTRSYTASPTSNTCRKPDRFEFEPAISGTVIPNTLSSDDSNPSWADECIPVSTSSLEWPIPAPDVNCQAKQRPNPSLPGQP